MDKYFFEDDAKAAALLVEAESWIGTPFMEFSKAKGIGGGIDCVGLGEMLMLAVGAGREFHFPRTLADYQSHQTGKKVLDYFRGKNPDPQSAELAKRCEEIVLPDWGEDNPPAEFFLPGDILALQHGGLFHLPVMIDRDRHFVSALPRLGVRRGTIQDSTFHRHFVAMFRVLALNSSSSAAAESESQESRGRDRLSHE